MSQLILPMEVTTICCPAEESLHPAPEVFAGGALDARAGLYALGVTLYCAFMRIK